MKKSIILSLAVFSISSFGFSQKIGDTKTVTAVSHLRAQASWDGCNAGSDTEESLYNPPPGWCVESYNTQSHGSSNGSKSVSVIAKGINYVSKSEWSKSFDELIDLAVKYEDKEGKAKLNQKKTEYEKYYKSVKSNKNTIHAKVKAKAHGTCLDRKRGWCEISVMAQLIYIGTKNDVKQTIQQLSDEYLLKQKDKITKKDVRLRKKELKKLSSNKQSL